MLDSRARVNAAGLLLAGLICLAGAAALRGSDNAPALRVLEFLPQGELEALGGDLEIRVRFDRPVVALARASELGDPGRFFTIEPPVAGRWLWSAADLAIFTPDAPLPGSTEFTVRLAGLTAADGAALPAPLVHRFSTPRIRCRFTETSGWPPTTPFIVECDQPAALSSLRSRLRASTKVHLPEIPEEERGSYGLVARPEPADAATMRRLDPRGAARMAERLELLEKNAERDGVELRLDAGAELSQGDSDCPGDGHCYRFRLLSRLPPDSAATVALEEGVQPRRGTLASDSRDELMSRRGLGGWLLRPDCKGECRLEDDWGFELTARVDPRKFSGRVRVRDLKTGKVQIYRPRMERLIANLPKGVREADFEFKRLLWHEEMRMTRLIWARIEPGGAYEVIFYPVKGALDYTAVTTLRFAHLPPYLLLNGEVRTSRPGEVKGLELRHRNIASARRVVAAISPERLPGVLRAHRLGILDFSVFESERAVLPAPLDRESVSLIELGREGGAQPPATLVAFQPEEISDGAAEPDCKSAPEAGPWRMIEWRRWTEDCWSGTLALSTDLGIVARRAGDSLLVAAHSLRTGDPVPGAQVSLSLEGDAIDWRGTTNEEGTVIAPVARCRNAGESCALVVLVRSGADFTALAAFGESDAIGSEIEYYSNDQARSPEDYARLRNDHSPEGGIVNAGERMAVLVTDRGIYSAGETLHFAYFERSRGTSGPIRPDAARIRYAVGWPAGPWCAGELELIDGAASASCALPRELVPGRVPVSVVSPGPSGELRAERMVLLAEYQRPELLVDLSGQPEIVAGDPGTVSLRVRRQNELPAGGLEVHAEWRGENAIVNPGAGAPDSRLRELRYGPRDLSFWWETGSREQGDVSHWRSKSTTRLAPGGGAEIELPIGAGFSMRPTRLHLDVRVADLDRRSISARTFVLVHPAQFYLGVRSNAGYWRPGERPRFQFAALTPDGRPLAGVQVAARLHRLRTRNDAKYWEPVEKRNLLSGAEPLEFAMDPLPPGEYRLALTARDSTGRVARSDAAVWVIGRGTTPVETLDVRLDRTECAAGETVHLLLRTPWPSGRALVNWETDRIIGSRTVRIESSRAELDIPCEPAAIPSQRLSIAAWRPPVIRDAPREPAAGMRDERWLLAGTATMRISGGVRRLSVDLATDAAAYLPGQSVRLTAQVRDARGAPTPAELWIWGVDEGVLRLTDYQPPDLLDAFHPLRSATGARWASLLSWHPGTRRERTGIPRYRDEGVRSRGGPGSHEEGVEGGVVGGVLGGVLGSVDGPPRERLESSPLLFWKTRLRLGADGRAELTIPLRDDLTTYRIMALATSGDDRFGEGETHIAVTRPVALTAALPRFLHPGDEAEAGVVVHARPGALGEATVRLEGDPSVEVGAGGVQRFTLGGDPARLVRFSLRSRREGAWRYTATVSIDGIPVDKLGGELRIRAVPRTETTVMAGEADPRAELRIAPPLGTNATLTVTLTNSPHGSVRPAVEQLQAYPYDCLEQRTSRLRLLLAADRHPGALGAMSEDERIALAAQLRGELSSLERYRTPGGGLAYWSGGESADAVLTARALALMGRAESAGYRPPAGLQDELRNWLARWLEQPNQPAWRTARLMIFEELAADHQSIDAWRSEWEAGARDEPPGDGLLRLSILSRLPDEAASARTLEKSLRNQVYFEADRAYFNPGRLAGWADCWCGWWSADATHMTARYLAALSRMDAEDPLLPRLARGLAARLGDSRRLNTFVIAESFSALADEFSARGEGRPVKDARILLNGLPRSRSGPLSPSSPRFAVEIGDAELRALFKDGREAALEVLREGRGRLYYTVRYRQDADPAAAEPLEAGFRISREILPLLDPAGDPRQFEGEPERMPSAAAPLREDYRAGVDYRVRVIVETTQERSELAIDVPLPAGFEALDPALSTTDRTTLDAERTPPRARREIRADRVAYFMQSMPPGRHEFVFRARAITPGRFVLPTAEAGEMYRPELFGRTASGWIRVDP